MRLLHFTFIFIPLLLLSCNEPKGEKDTEDNSETIEKELPKDSTEMTPYRNNTWHFAIDFPPTFTVLESKLPGNTPVINLYEKKPNQDPPFAFHEAPEAFYISFMPKGFGTEMPNGKQLSFNDWGKSLPVNFKLNKEKSKVFLLENDQPWAFMLKVDEHPKDWDEYGTIFIHLPIDNFNATCFSVAGESKPMESCDPMGEDSVKFFGKIADSDIERLYKMIESLTFFDADQEKKQIAELIQIEKPLPNKDISSPLTIKGKARGYWFFEGSFPFKLEDANGNELVSGIIEAKDNWMTENFVAFEKEIVFNAPDDERGYLVFNRSNASGKPEHDRVYRLPILFPPK